MKQAGRVVVTGIKRRVLVGCLTLLIGVPAMACCLFGMWTYFLPYMERLTANQQGGGTPLLLLVVAALLLVGLIVIPAASVGVVTLKRARMLDAVLTPLGLQGEMYMMVGRHYWGKVGGVEVDIYIYRGPTLEIRLPAQSKTRVQILPQSTIPVKVSGVLQKAPLTLSNPQLGGYAVYAEDEAWAQRLFADDALPDLLQSLIFKHIDWPIFRHVEIQPGEVMLYLHRSTKLFVNREQFTAVEKWINDLARLAVIVNAQPAPASVLQSFSGNSREEKQTKSRRLLLLVLSILIGLPAVLITIGVVAFLLVSR